MEFHAFSAAWSIGLSFIAMFLVGTSMALEQRRSEKVAAFNFFENPLSVSPVASINPHSLRLCMTVRGDGILCAVMLFVRVAGS